MGKMRHIRSKVLKCQHGPTNTYILSSPIGDLEVVSCPRGLHGLSQPSVIADHQFHPNTSVLVDLKEQLYKDNGYTYKPILQCVQWLQSYFESVPQPLPPICYMAHGPAGSFTQRVWQTLAEKIPYGRTTTYAHLAMLSGSPKACRAVGQAMRNNPFMVLVPCHRVVLASGEPGSYCGGQKNSVKLWLLHHEQTSKT